MVTVTWDEGWEEVSKGTQNLVPRVSEIVVYFNSGEKEGRVCV